MADPGKRDTGKQDRGKPQKHEEGGTAIHPEALGPPEHLKADLEDVIHLFDHAGTESDEPDIRSDSPAP